MAFQEEDPQTAFFVPSAYARDYTNNAYPVVKGAKLGILIDNATSAPIEQVASIVSSGAIDIGSSTSSYKAIYSNTTSIS